MWFKVTNISEKPIANIEVSNFTVRTPENGLKENKYEKGYYNFNDIIPKNKEVDIMICFTSDYTGNQINEEEPFSEEYFEADFDCIVSSIYGTKSIQKITIIANADSELVKQHFDYGGKKYIVECLGV
jgi:hypothetical protein